MEMRTSRHWIARELDRRIEKNSSYSLRSFARHAGLSPSYLSRVISSQRSLSFRSALIMVEALNLSEKDKQELIDIVKSEQALNNKKSNDNDIQKPGKGEQSYQLSLDTFAIISKWYHFGITQLMNLDGYKSDFNWMAKMLDITAFEVSQAIERLRRVGLIDIDENGEYYRTKSSFKSSDDIVSQGLREFHREILAKATDSLENDSVKDRDISSMTIAVNKEQIPKAKEEIRKFQNKMVKLLQKGNKAQVYNLGINLIPISRSNGE